MPIVRRLSLILLPIALLGAVAFWIASNYRAYEVQELIFTNRYQRYDSLIEQAARRYHVSPSLIKAVIWRESRFQPDMRGNAGERGLMQITEIAAKDWSVAEKIETFSPPDLFDPKTNIDAGTWYLSRALKHWAAKDDPIPFALAEYNAGRMRVKRWERDAKDGVEFTADDLRATMDFPSTRNYITAIMDRYQAYLKRRDFREDALH